MPKKLENKKITLFAPAASGSVRLSSEDVDAAEEVPAHSKHARTGSSLHTWSRVRESCDIGFKTAFFLAWPLPAPTPVQPSKSDLAVLWHLVHLRQLARTLENFLLRCQFCDVNLAKGVLPPVLLHVAGTPVNPRNTSS